MRVVAGFKAALGACRQRQSGFVHLPQGSKQFRPPAGGRVTFLLRGQEKSNPKRRPPRGGASRPSMDGKSVRRGRAFRPDSCPVEKASPSLAMPAARPLRPRLTATEGPRNSSALPARRGNSHSKAEQGQATRSAAILHPSVSRYGAGWPPPRSCRRERLHHPRHTPLVVPADRTRPFLWATLLWASKKGGSGAGRRPKPLCSLRNASESPPQASQAAEPQGRREHPAPRSCKRHIYDIS